MIIRDLRELQELVFRTGVRNMMFVATLPYRLWHGAARNPAGERAAAVAGDRCRSISGRPPHGSRSDDVRWLR